MASGLPAEPWAVYKKPEGGYLQVKYDPYLRCVATCDITSCPTRRGQYTNAHVSWVEEPRVHVAGDTHCVYDRSVNRSRVIVKANWTYAVAATFAFVHFGWMIWGLARGHTNGSIMAIWIVSIDVAIGVILRATSIFIAKSVNRGSWLQVAIAFSSPTFWSMAYAGPRTVDLGWVWMLPLLVRVLAAVLSLVINTFKAATTHRFVDIGLIVVGIMFENNRSFDVRVLRHYILRTRAVTYEVDFLFMASCGHFYTLMTHINLLSQGELPLVLVALACLAATEAVVLLQAACELERVMQADTVVARIHKTARTRLLAGSVMVCDVRKGVREMFGEDDCDGVYVTWIVRGTVPSAWENMAILLPGPWGGTCDVVARDVAYCDSGDEDVPVVVCCVVSLQSTDENCGDTCVGMQPILKDIFLEAEALGVEAPSMMYVRALALFPRSARTSWASPYCSGRWVAAGFAT